MLRGKNVVEDRVKLGLSGDFTENLHYFIKGMGCFILLVIGIVSSENAV